MDQSEMKKFLLIGTALTGAGEIAAADSVDVTLGAILEDVTFFGLNDMDHTQFSFLASQKDG